MVPPDGQLRVEFEIDDSRSVDDSLVVPKFVPHQINRGTPLDLS